MRGFRLGFEVPGGPSGAFRPSNLAKEAGVSDMASAGGGRPVILAIKVRAQRMIVKIPRT